MVYTRYSRVYNRGYNLYNYCMPLSMLLMLCTECRIWQLSLSLLHTAYSIILQLQADYSALHSHWIIHREPKMAPFYFRNNFVKPRSILTNFGVQLSDCICNTTAKELFTAPSRSFYGFLPTLCPQKTNVVGFVFLWTHCTCKTHVSICS